MSPIEFCALLVYHISELGPSGVQFVLSVENLVGVRMIHVQKLSGKFVDSSDLGFLKKSPYFCYFPETSCLILHVLLQRIESVLHDLDLFQVLSGHQRGKQFSLLVDPSLNRVGVSIQLVQ